jgi:hypothetical protein
MHGETIKIHGSISLLFELILGLVPPMITLIFEPFPLFEFVKIKVNYS